MNKKPVTPANKKKKKKPAKQVVQRHHILYGDKPEQEVIVPVTKAEHWIITQLQRHGSLSRGCVQAILHILALKPERMLPSQDQPA